MSYSLEGYQPEFLESKFVARAPSISVLFRVYLQNHLFHPFSQENPLQTGTGLGLAIVNSIVRSRSVDGKVDVWSAEGVGTEIKKVLELQSEQHVNTLLCVRRGEAGRTQEYAQKAHLCEKISVIVRRRSLR